MMPAPRPVFSAASLLASDLSPGAKVAALAIGHAADATGLCTLSPAQLIAATGLPDRSLRRALHELVEAQIITPVRTAGRAVAFTLTSGGQTGGQIGGQTGGQVVEKIVENQRPASKPSSGQSPPHSPPITTTPLTLFGDEEGGSGGKPKRRVPHRLPGDWTPSPELMAYARRQYPGADLDRILAEFIWFWTQERPEKRADWNSAFRKRVDAVAGRPAGSGAPGGARAPSPASRPAGESDGMRRLRDLAARMETDR